MTQGGRFSRLHEAMQRLVDDEILAGVSSAVLVGHRLVDLHCAGWADREAGIALRPEHIFRVFSNTKLVTSCAALLLMEEGRFGLDDPIGDHLPQLAQLRVLKPGATRLDDTEPARGPVRIRHLFSHSAGLGHGLMDPSSPLFDAYGRDGVRDPGRTLEEMVQALSRLPLLFQPGSDWRYSVATDVLGRLVEVLGGESLGDFFRRRIFEPLGMRDTGFVVPPADHSRLVACYEGKSREDPWQPGLVRTDAAPFPGAYLKPVPRQAGGGGLVSTLPDMVALVRSLLPGAAGLLKPQTVALLMANQLPRGIAVGIENFPPTPGKGFSLAGAVTLLPSADEPSEASGELEWGGIAGTHWWISPANDLAGIVMAQRHWSFWHPFSLLLKREVYRGALDPARGKRDAG